ncbi:hypothetical protein AB0F91_46195 [Amycolatopsis sp. NPDC023774]|uniref:hypothetical protein n=1 Tax=Amycolatopsis sp. NPDC023774 TaxID=3155015 RepID=UPI0033C7F798
MTATLATEDDFTGLLHQMCAQVVTAVPGVHEAGITLLSDHHPATVASTTEVVTALDRDQYATGHGPCLQAADTGKLVRVSVAEVAEEWPDHVLGHRRARAHPQKIL